jgi:hypothetical protein
MGNKISEKPEDAAHLPHIAITDEEAERYFDDSEFFKVSECIDIGKLKKSIGMDIK